MFWNPWHGCKKCSPGCANCYVYYLDGKRDKDPSVVVRSKTGFDLPKKRDRYGNYKIPPGKEIATCFTSDFFIEEADEWRCEAWELIRSRPDVNFLICTKRISRFSDCIPHDWNDGYDNVTVAVSCETQQKADERLPHLLTAPFKGKNILCEESFENARICDFDWIKRIKSDCDRYGVKFDFHQTGSNFVMDGKHYKIKHADEYTQAKKGMAYLDTLGKK